MPLPEFSSHIAALHPEGAWTALHLANSAKEEFLKVTALPADQVVQFRWSTSLGVTDIAELLPGSHEAKIMLQDFANEDPKNPPKEVVFTANEQDTPDIVFKRMGGTVNTLCVNVAYSETTILPTPESTIKHIETLLESTASFNVSRHAGSLITASLELIREQIQ